MEDRRHNDEVIVERLGNLINSFNEYKQEQVAYHQVTSKQIGDIHDQVKYTNGKVRKQELSVARIWGGISVIVALVLPMVFWFIANYITNK